MSHEETHRSWSRVLCINNHILFHLSTSIIMSLATWEIFLLERSLLVTNFIRNKARLFVICTLKTELLPCCLLHLWNYSSLLQQCVFLYRCYFVGGGGDTMFFENMHFSLGLQIVFFFLSVYIFVIWGSQYIILFLT